MAVPGPAHQPVGTEEDRLLVAVLGSMGDAENAQCYLEWRGRMIERRARCDRNAAHAHVIQRLQRVPPRRHSHSPRGLKDRDKIKIAMAAVICDQPSHGACVENASQTNPDMQSTAAAMVASRRKLLRRISARTSATTVFSTCNRRRPSAASRTAVWNICGTSCSAISVSGRRARIRRSSARGLFLARIHLRKYG